jgi:hypothetical protein
VICPGTFDQDLTGVDEREREAHLARVSDEESGEGVQGWNSGDAPVTSDADGELDGDQ